MSGITTIVLTVADARTGISEFQISDRFADAGSVEAAPAPVAFAALSKFIYSMSEAQAR
jgi:hypothetical protein